MSARCDRWMQQKHSQYRNQVAKCLNVWRKTKSTTKTSQILKISEPTIRSCLRKSKIYNKFKYTFSMSKIGENYIKTQMTKKNSDIRKLVANALKIYRKTKNTQKTSKEIGMGKCKTRRILRLSKFYKSTNKTQEKIIKKNSPERKKLALILNNWRKHHSLKQTSADLRLNLSTIRNLVILSKIYRKSKYLRKNNAPNYAEIEMKTKNSKYRNLLAKILRSWKTLRSTKQVGIHLKISENIVCKMIYKSNVYKNRTRYTEKEREYARKWGKKIWCIKQLKSTCENCGNRDILVLEFHHHSKNKESTISDLIQKYREGDMLKIKREIKKCNLLCKNCHQEMHNPNPKNRTNKILVMKINGINKCTECGYSKNTACLEFHHKNTTNKTMLIGHLCRDGVSKNTLAKKRKEIKSCEILCCNCHNKKQIKLETISKLSLLIEIYTRLAEATYDIM